MKILSKNILLCTLFFTANLALAQAPAVFKIKLNKNVPNQPWNVQLNYYTNFTEKLSCNDLSSKSPCNIKTKPQSFLPGVIYDIAEVKDSMGTAPGYIDPVTCRGLNYDEFGSNYATDPANILILNFVQGDKLHQNKITCEFVQSKHATN